MIPLIPDITCNPGKEILLWLVPKNLLYFGKPACLVNRKGRLKQESTTYNWTPKKQTADFKMTKDVNISPKKIQVVNMHRKRCSISPTTMIHHRPVIRMVMREKKGQNNKCWQGCRKIETSVYCCLWGTCYGKEYRGPQHIKTEWPCDAAILLLGMSANN